MSQTRRVPGRRVAAGRWFAALVAGSVLLSAGACARVPKMRGEIDGLDDLIRQADRNGAKRCAPRELALATAHTRFAGVELDQADVFRAEEHLMLARVNAQAAYDLSPASQCSERRFVMETPQPVPEPPPPPPPPEPGDADGDGIIDDLDRCPKDPENYNGFEDDDGCPDDPDSDGDGIPDSKDHCELLPEDKDGYLDDDGCPDTDNDLDSVADSADGEDGKCKSDPEDPDGHQDEDGCPELDNDSDEVPDLQDECPMVPGVKHGARPGCPAKKPTLVVVTDTEIKITQQIHFAFGKATIRPVSYPVLDAVVQVLKDNPKIKIDVEGHTDNVGSAWFNKQLSQQRADSVMSYLTRAGISRDRLVSHGYGMERPLVPNDSDRNRALNRRVQFVRTEKK